ncbi:MAG: DUF5591 domain-containing protein [Candidatus Helarchaeota archaeon]
MKDLKKKIYVSFNDINRKEVIEFYINILSSFKSQKNKNVLLIVQCSKTKPYSESLSHRYIRNVIKKITGYDPKNEHDACPIQIIVLSSLLGPVPYECQKDFPALNYSLSINKLNTKEFNYILPILSERLKIFLFKVYNDYDHIIAFVKNNYRKIVENVKKDTNLDINIIPKNKHLHFIREASTELEFELEKIKIKRRYKSIDSYLK